MTELTVTRCGNCQEQFGDARSFLAHRTDWADLCRSPRRLGMTAPMISSGGLVWVLPDDDGDDAA